jgi:hypothetical protein
MATTTESLLDRTIPNFPDLEGFERSIGELSDRWAPQARITLHWFQRWLTAWNAHDLDLLTTLVTDDMAWEDPIMVGETVNGKDEFREYIETFWRGFPDVVFTPTAPPLLGVEGMCMAVPWRMLGTLTGELAWWGKRYEGKRPPAFAPTNRRADLEGYDIYGFRDGLLAHYTIVCDFLTLSQQLGLAPQTDSRVNAVMLRFQRLTAPLARRQAHKHAGG